jgi:hypothetical protein
MEMARPQRLPNQTKMFEPSDAVLLFKTGGQGFKLKQNFGPFVKMASLIPFHKNLTKFMKPYHYQNL